MYLVARLSLVAQISNLGQLFNLAGQNNVVIHEYRLDDSSASMPASEQVINCICHYREKDSLDRLIGLLDVSDSFRVLKVFHESEEHVRGGLLVTRIRGNPESIDEVEKVLFSSRELVSNRVAKGEGRNFTGVSTGVGILSLLHGSFHDNEPGNDYYHHKMSGEMSALLLSHLTGNNGIPLVISAGNHEELVKSLWGLEHNFHSFRIDFMSDRLLRENDLRGDLHIPLLYRQLDEEPLAFLSLILNRMWHYGFNPKELTLGMIGLSPGAVRLTRLLVSMGIKRVLGLDTDDTRLIDFENAGGLATIEDNVYGNADIIIYYGQDAEDGDCGQLHPGQVVMSFASQWKCHSEVARGQGMKGLDLLSPVMLDAIFLSLSGNLEHINDTLADDSFIISLAQKIADSDNSPLYASNLQECLDLLKPLVN